MLKAKPIYVYVYHHIPFLINSQPPMAGSQHKHPFCEAHYTHPVQTTKANAHVFKYNLLTISSPWSVQSCVCETSYPAWGKKEGKTSWQYATIAHPLVTTNAQSNTYIRLCLPSRSIPEIKAQLTTTYGRHTASILSVRFTMYTHPVQTTKAHAHVCKYNLLTISSPWSVQSCVCETSDHEWRRREGKRSVC